MLPSSAFSPAHITGFFTIEKKGSNGAGFTLGNGMETNARVLSESGERTLISIAGKKSAAPVSRAVVENFRRITGSAASLSISHSPFFPIGYGLGMSAAGSLSLSFALNEVLHAHLSRTKCTRIGFDAEVKCGTGLSAIFAEEIGGFISRKKLGGEVARVRLGRKERGLHVVCAFLAPMKTSSVIRSSAWKKKINLAGKRALENFFADKSLSNFIAQSRAFAFETGIATKRVRKILSENPLSAMAMLGETVFEFTDEPEEAAKRFKRYAKNVIISRIGEKGARLL